MAGSKPTVATMWLSSCSGCHISFLDLHEELADVLKVFDIVYSPVLMDIKSIPECDYMLVEGAVNTDEDVEMLQQARSKAKQLISLGSCACFGGISGMRNFYDPSEVLNQAYRDAPNTDMGQLPNENIPSLLPRVKTVADVVDIDFMVPGCPFVPDVLKEVLLAFAEGKTPTLETRNLCHDCGRNHEKLLVPTRQLLSFRLFSPMEAEMNPDLCFLEQGVLCVGPATRAGCGARCLSAGMPCRGCMGPNPKQADQGCGTVDALASLLPIGLLKRKEDLPGTVYRYSFPASLHVGKSSKER